MTSSYVPFDVWKCIACFLSNEDLKPLHSVNRAFRYIAQQIEYRNIGIVVWDKKEKERLRALGYVGSLCICIPGTLKPYDLL